MTYRGWEAFETRPQRFYSCRLLWRKWKRNEKSIASYLHHNSQLHWEQNRLPLTAFHAWKRRFQVSEKSSVFNRISDQNCIGQTGTLGTKSAVIISTDSIAVFLPYEPLRNWSAVSVRYSEVERFRRRILKRKDSTIRFKHHTASWALGKACKGPK